MSPSTAHPEALPDIPTLRWLTQSLAMLDAILCPEWEYRHYSFDANWGEGEQMASMRDGCGNDWFLLFDSGGAVLKGYDHECAVARDGGFAATMQASLPAGLQPFLDEPGFVMEYASFCLWRQNTDAAWQVVPSPVRGSGPYDDGSTGLLKLLDGKPGSYQTWAEYYLEREVLLSGVQSIYAHHPLDLALAVSLNPDAVWEDVLSDAAEIGYPVAASA